MSAENDVKSSERGDGSVAAWPIALTSRSIMIIIRAPQEKSTHDSSQCAWHSTHASKRSPNRGCSSVGLGIVSPFIGYRFGMNRVASLFVTRSGLGLVVNFGERQFAIDGRQRDRISPCIGFREQPPAFRLANEVLHVRRLLVDQHVFLQRV